MYFFNNFEVLKNNFSKLFFKSIAKNDYSSICFKILLANFLEIKYLREKYKILKQNIWNNNISLSFLKMYLYITMRIHFCQEKLQDKNWQIMTEVIIPAKSASSAATKTKRIFFIFTQAV